MLLNGEIFVPNIMKSYDKNIILVEDDLELAELTSKYLASHGYNIIVVNDGLAAVKTIINQQPDLVILDLMLPNLDGHEVCMRIRQKYSNPILMYTARNDGIDEILGLEVGADDYISKPVEPRLLAARVKALLRRSSTTAASTRQDTSLIEINGLLVNSKSRTVSLNRMEISLTTPEYDLLWILISNAGLILSREYIFENLRGVGYDGFNRSIDIIISRLRAKLNDNPSTPEIIKTIRNKGYLLSM